MRMELASRARFPFRRSNKLNDGARTPRTFFSRCASLVCSVHNVLSHWYHSYNPEPSTIDSVQPSTGAIEYDTFRSLHVEQFPLYHYEIFNRAHFRSHHSRSLSLHPSIMTAAGEANSLPVVLICANTIFRCKLQGTHGGKTYLSLILINLKEPVSFCRPVVLSRRGCPRCMERSSEFGRGNFPWLVIRRDGAFL